MDPEACDLPDGTDVPSASLPPPGAPFPVSPRRAQALFDILRSETLLAHALATAGSGDSPSTAPTPPLRLPRSPEGVWVQWLQSTVTQTPTTGDPLLVWGRGPSTLPAALLGVSSAGSRDSARQLIEAVGAPGPATRTGMRAVALLAFDRATLGLLTSTALPDNAVLVCERDPAGELFAGPVAQEVLARGGSVVWPSVPRGAPGPIRRHEARRLFTAVTAALTLFQPTPDDPHSRDLLRIALSRPRPILAPCPPASAPAPVRATHVSLTGDRAVVSVLVDSRPHRDLVVVDVPADQELPAAVPLVPATVPFTPVGV